MDNLSRSRLQREHLEQRKAAQQKAAEEQKRYMASEDFQKDLHENRENFWLKKARREGWHYQPKSFTTAADRERMAEEKKREEIAYLRERLQELEAEAEK